VTALSGLRLLERDDRGNASGLAAVADRASVVALLHRARLGFESLSLVPTALLALLFDLMARREEVWLIERFPEYAANRAGTPRRFVPWLY
jgi:hypothetical protein